MNGIVLQVGTVVEFLQELRIDADFVEPKIIRAHVQLAPAPVAPNLQVRKGMDPGNKRNVWVVASAILRFSLELTGIYVLRMELFTGEMWIAPGGDQAGYTEAISVQKAIQDLCVAMKWQFRSGLWRYQGEQI